MFRLPMKPSEYAPNPVPSLEEWRGLWMVWDIITKTMTPQEELLSKPIKLRNALIFYLGHIPTFLGTSIGISSVLSLTCTDGIRHPSNSGDAR